VDYPALIPLLIEAMHELDDKIALLSTNRKLTSQDENILENESKTNMKFKEIKESLNYKEDILTKMNHLSKELEFSYFLLHYFKRIK